ncbi:MAG TPA: universal stress protein [Stellaceae bacterium]|nr:universal stress protein [Stellaceae bacterium]
MKDILVHLDGSARSGAVMAFAAGLARRCLAHLTAVYTLEFPALEFFAGPSDLVDLRFVDETIERLRERARDNAAKIEQEFRERLRRDGIAGEWRLVEGFTAQRVAQHARYADLAILGQRDPRDPSLAARTDTPSTVLMASGRPILVLPRVGDYPSAGRHVLVGWKSSREAAHAVNDALPLLQRAQAVTVLAVNPEGGVGADGDMPAADIALHLARHGVNATAAHTVAKDIPEGDALLNYAADIEADLIVAGGYGHSRMRELAFGGVTRVLLETMTVPVFLSH